MPLVENRILDNVPGRRRPSALLEPRDALIERARWLLPRERNLLELALLHGVPRRHISRTLQIHPATVSRRIQSILRRLHRPLVRNLVDPKSALPGELRQIGIGHFLQNQSARQLARRHQLSVHCVRQMLLSVRIWHEATSTSPQAIRTG